MIYKIIQNVDKDGDGEVVSWDNLNSRRLQSVYNYLDGKDGLEDNFKKWWYKRL